jgi:hypothetical protein
MSALLVAPDNPPRPARRVWLPLAVSLALHALFALAAVTFTAGQGVSAGGPVPVNTVVDADGGGTIILEGRPAGRGNRAAASQSVEEESSEPTFTAKIDLAPVVNPVSVPADLRG